jgi:hypothetical protein
LSAQSNLSGLCRRLLAALSLMVVASLAASAPALAGRSGLQNANPADHSLLSGLRGLIEEEASQYPDTAAGDPGIKAAILAARLLVAAEPPRRARPPLADAAPPRTHAARAGLTRAPPPA